MAGRIGHGARSRANTSSSSRTCSAMACRRRRAITPEPYNGPRFPLVTACDNVRAATSAGDRKIRHQKASARHRLVDGRAADLSLGRALSRHGRAHRAILRLGQMLAPQFRVPRRRQGGADRRRAPLPTAGTKKSRPKACARRRGSMPAGDFRRPSIASGSISSAWAIPRSRIFSSPSGKASSCRRTPTTS